MQRQAHLLGEQVHTVEENSFAQRVKVRISLGGDESREMEVLKSNNQLTQEERLEKKRLLSELDLEIKHCQAVLAALRYLQVYHREISGKLKGIVPEAVSLRPEPSSRVGKVLWTKGVNSAAHHCHSEGKRQQASDAHLLQLCEAFLARYVIQEEPAYTSEQLFNNVRQIRLLDASE